MTPEEALAAAQHEQNVQAVAAFGPVALDGWRLTLEILAGQVAVAVEHGWPEDLARRLVAASFEANCHASGTRQ